MLVHSNKPRILCASAAQGDLTVEAVYRFGAPVKCFEDPGRTDYIESLASKINTLVAGPIDKKTTCVMTLGPRGIGKGFVTQLVCGAAAVAHGPKLRVILDDANHVGDDESRLPFNLLVKSLGTTSAKFMADWTAAGSDALRFKSVVRELIRQDAFVTYFVNHTASLFNPKRDEFADTFLDQLTTITSATSGRIMLIFCDAAVVLPSLLAGFKKPELVRLYPYIGRTASRDLNTSKMSWMTLHRPSVDISDVQKRMVACMDEKALKVISDNDPLIALFYTMGNPRALTKWRPQSRVVYETLTDPRLRVLANVLYANFVAVNPVALLGSEDAVMASWKKDGAELYGISWRRIEPGVINVINHYKRGDEKRVFGDSVCWSDTMKLDEMGVIMLVDGIVYPSSLAAVCNADPAIKRLGEMLRSSFTDPFPYGGHRDFMKCSNFDDLAGATKSNVERATVRFINGEFDSVPKEGGS